MKIALLTGASSGLGRALCAHIAEFYPEIEELWVVARREERLKALSDEISKPRIVPIAIDICDEHDFARLTDKLREEYPDIMLLVNNAGCGYLGDFSVSVEAEQLRSIELNVRALTKLTRTALEFMPKGARILNTSSIASFSPTPNMAVYCATKAFVTFFSRALSEELRPSGRSSTAVCPAPMNTEFLAVGHVTGNSKLFERMPFLDVNKVAVGALKAARKRRSVYTPGILYKVYRVLSRILPDCLLIKLTKA